MLFLYVYERSQPTDGHLYNPIDERFDFIAFSFSFTLISRCSFVAATRSRDRVIPMNFGKLKSFFRRSYDITKMKN